jgi:hypothetical protein
MMTPERRWALRTMSDELDINKETLRHILHGYSRQRNICSKQRRLTSCQGFIQTCQDNPIFSLLHFLFPNVKTAFRGKRFRDAEGIEEDVTAELKDPPLEASAVFKNFCFEYK